MGGEKRGEDEEYEGKWDTVVKERGRGQGNYRQKRGGVDLGD